MPDAERQHTQRTVDMVSDLMHSFSHAYHAASDFKFSVVRYPRLSVDQTVVRHAIPMQVCVSFFDQ